MQKRAIFICLVLILLVSSIASAQQGRGNGGGQHPPPADGDGGGNNNGGGRNGNGAGAITFPSGYASSFHLYTVVDRPDNISRLIYINPEVLPALQAGEELPNGTTLVIEAYNSTTGADGRLVRGERIPFIHVSQKINDRWHFASFTLAGVPADRNMVDENPRTCIGCHNDTEDFTFTRAEIDAFAASQVVQYFFCGLAEREPCS